MTHALNPGTIVFHPDHGHCKVVGEREEVLLRVPTQVMELTTLGEKPVLFRVPLTEKSRIQRLRPLTAAAELESALLLLKEPASQWEANEDTRKKAYQEKFRAGRIEDLVGILRDVNKLKNTVAIGTADRKAMDLAKAHLLLEMMLVLNLTKLEARKRVEDLMKPVKKEKANSTKGHKS